VGSRLVMSSIEKLLLLSVILRCPPQAGLEG
jgi:hypothetical protein